MPPTGVPLLLAINAALPAPAAPAPDTPPPGPSLRHDVRLRSTRIGVRRDG